MACLVPDYWGFGIKDNNLGILEEMFMGLGFIQTKHSWFSTNTLPSSWDSRGIQIIFLQTSQRIKFSYFNPISSRALFQSSCPSRITNMFFRGNDILPWPNTSPFWMFPSGECLICWLGWWAVNSQGSLSQSPLSLLLLQSFLYSHSHFFRSLGEK